MCFSATSSFIVATALLGVGGVAIKKTKSKNYSMLIAVPILFALQQFAEGIVWLTIGNTGYDVIHYLAAYTFLIFALVIWPVWIPLSLQFIEKNKQRRKILLFLISIGTLIAIAAASVIINYDMTPKVMCKNIMYDINFNYTVISHMYLLFYAISVIGSFFVVKLKYARIVGLAILSTLLFSYIFLYTTFISVWCFFAAVISAMVLLVVW